MTEKVLCSCTT